MAMVMARFITGVKGAVMAGVMVVGGVLKHVVSVGVHSVIISVRIIVLRIMVVGALVLIAEVVEVGTDFTESVKNNKKKYTSLYLSLYLVLLPSVPSFISLLSSRILTFKTANTDTTNTNTMHNTNTSDTLHRRQTCNTAPV